MREDLEALSLHSMEGALVAIYWTIMCGDYWRLTNAEVVKPMAGHFFGVKHVSPSKTRGRSTSFRRRPQSNLRNSSHSVTIRIASAPWAVSKDRHSS